MLNTIWLAMIVAAIVCGAWTGKLDLVAKASTDSANAAVTLAIGLVGVMTFWLGLMRVLHDGGLLRALARGLRPVMVRLFPDVPADHPAMSMMILNITSNMLGLGNAATPFGLKAMMELDKLNAQKGTATNAMVLFLALNTSGLSILPTGMIAVRASLGSTAPGSIFLPTLIATTCSTAIALIVTKLVEPFWRAPPAPSAAPIVTAAAPAPATESREVEAAMEKFEEERPPLPPVQRLLGLAVILVVIASLGLAIHRQATGTVETTGLGWSGALTKAVNEWPLVLLIIGFVLYGAQKGVKVYDSIVEGGREGFQVALRIIPYLVVILVAIGMLRASGAIELMVRGLDPVTSLIGMPGESLPMALLRPLSGSGAYAVAAEIMKTHGPDSLLGQIVATMQGSTETTFYVLALYFGAVQVKNARHAIIPCLAADVAGLLMSVWACRWLLT